MKLFDADGPLMQGLNKVADLMILNIIALLCCVPIITIGASITALYYMALKIVRGEEVYIFKGFMKSFKHYRAGTFPGDFAYRTRNVPVHLPSALQV